MLINASCQRFGKIAVMASWLEWVKSKFRRKPTRPPDQVVAAGVAEETDTAGPVGITVGYDPNRPWHEQWGRVTHGLTRLEDLCKAGGWQGNQVLQEAVQNFFTDCYHVADWVGNSAATPVNFNHARAYVEADSDLRIGAGMANTAKHHERTKPNSMVVKFQEISVCPDRTSHALLLWTKGQRSGSVDALDLARRCVTAWEAYLRTNNIPTS
jgi:hypothetical protein